MRKFQQGEFNLLAVTEEGYSPTLKVENIMVDYAVDPMGIDNKTPAFFWSLSDPSVRGQKQTAYRIVVSTTEEKAQNGQGDVWDSGMVLSNITSQVPFGGKLSPSTRYFWRVMVWDKDEKIACSEVARFETGLMETGFEGARFIAQDLSDDHFVDFTLDGANWIWLLDGDKFHLAKEGGEYFVGTLVLSEKEITSALLAFTIDDYGTIYVNGTKVFTAEPTSDRWKLGNVVNITECLTSGENRIAAEVVNAATGFGGFLAKIQIKFSDGSKEYFVTDTSWLCTRKAAHEGFEKSDFQPVGWSAPDQSVEYGGFPWGDGVSLPTTAMGADQGGSAPILRKSFFLYQKDVRFARVYATAAGLYSMELNGRKVGDDYLSPGFTEYGDHLMYQTFDVTGLLKEQENILTATLGNGWYIGAIGASFRGRFPAFLMKLLVTYTDGTTQVIVTDETWEMTLDGSVIENDLFNGESYDATRDPSSFTYAPVSCVTREDLNIGTICSQIAGTNIRCMDTLEPVCLTRPTENTLIYDFGQNLSGVVEITVKGKRGTRVILRHGEMLNDGSNGSDGPNGTLYTTNLRTAKATDVYICTGGTDTWSPVFTYHGFRYVEITGIGEEDILCVKAKVLYSALVDSSTFTCSNKLLERLSSNAYWGQRGNFLSVPTDCPQRDERMGWSGDAQIFVGTAAYQMDVKRFYEQYLMDLNDCQRENGAYTDCAPAANRPGYSGEGHGGWADAGIIIPYTLVLRYGDLSIVEKYYDNMGRYIEYLVKDAGDFIRNTQFHYGDWLSFGEDTPVELCDTACCAYVCHLMSIMAGWLGKQTDAAHYENYFQRFRSAWNETYLKENGRTTADTQTSYVLGLYFNIIPEDKKKMAAARLNEKIRQNGDRLTTGFMGVSYLLPTLCDYGYVDTAFALLEQTACPSWLYPVTQGATTIWERWNSYNQEIGFGDAGMNSYNHYSYGSVMEWVYGYLLGIRVDEKTVGFEHFVLAPTLGGSLTYAKGSYKSIHGWIESGWKICEGEVLYTCVVPANTRATIQLPCDAKTLILPDDVAVSWSESGRTICQVESGSYVFRFPQ